MKRILPLILIAFLALNIVGCKSPYKKRQKQYSKRLYDHPDNESDAIKRMNKRKK